jgi:leucyl aminopeptidase
MEVFRNRINFVLEEPRKLRKEVGVLVFESKEDIKNTLAFKYLRKELQDFILESLKKINLPEGEHIHVLDSPWGSLILLKLKEKLDHRAYYLKVRQIIKFAKDHRKESLAIYLDDLRVDDMDREGKLEKFVINALMADFNFKEYYEKEKVHTLKEVYLLVQNANKYKAIVKNALIIGEETNRARFLSNLPGGDLTPDDMVDICQKVAKESDLRIKVLNYKILEKLGAGAILGVGRGSKYKPYIVILEHRKDKKLPEVNLIGKGITFDTGGLHIKPPQSMSDMHLDMSGAASLLSLTSALSKLNFKTNIVTLLSIAENMPSGESYRPGDILRSISGKTIEIGSPDAEGRVVMADAIDYGKKFYKPKLIITLATLTGAACVALGDKASAVFSPRKELLDLIEKAGENSGDYVWPLPLWREYEEEIKGKFAEVTNYPNKREGGAIHGAVFLWYFVKPIENFIHIDMAPRMIASEKEFLNPGSVGFGVRLLYEFFKSQEKLYEIIK